MERKLLWKFYWDCGREGYIEGLFVATKDEAGGLVGKQVYFGEVLGKHSEIYGEIESDEITQVPLDDESITKVAAVLGDTWSGYNPLHYLREEE